MVERRRSGGGVKAEPGQPHSRKLRTLLELGDGACAAWGALARAVKVPFIAFPAGVDVEGVMVLVNARGRAIERQFIVIHPPAAVPHAPG